jgi:hypothetical protein
MNDRLIGGRSSETHTHEQQQMGSNEVMADKEDPQFNGASHSSYS